MFSNLAHEASGKPLTFLNVASDYGASKRGASLGPQALRFVALENAETAWFHAAAHCNLGADTRFFDTLTDFQYARFLPVMLPWIRKIAGSVTNLLTNERFPFIISGDHFNAFGTLCALMEEWGPKTGVVWVDAHGDLHSPWTTPSGNLHGMPLSAALKNRNIRRTRNKPCTETIAAWEELENLLPGALDPNLLTFIAIRDLEAEETGLLNDLSISRYLPETVRTPEAAQNVATEILEKYRKAGVQRIYLSFDVDSMDPSVSRGTGTPVEGGMDLPTTTALLKTFFDSPLLGCLEVVEINPLLDDQNKMARSVMSILQNLLENQTMDI